MPLLHRARRVVCGALRRVGRRAAAVTVVALAAVVAAAGPAVAHPTLLRTVPAAGYTGDGPVRQLTLAFDEPVTATADALAVSTAAGSHVPTQPLRREAGGRQLVLPLVNPLTSGQFRVHWQLTAADGDVVDGTFTFGVGTPAPTAVGGGNTAGAAATAALRWILFTALALATGGLVGERLARRRAARSALPTVGAPLRLAAVVGLLAAAGLTGLVAPAAGGWTALTHVRAVELTAVEAGAFAVSLALAMVTPLRRFTAAPLAAVVIAEGLRGHPNAYSAGWGAVLTAVHLGAAAVWVGALVHVVRTAHRWQDDRGRARALLRGYAQIALGLFLLVAATGTVASLLVLRTPRDLVSTGYGRVLAGKLLLVAIVTVLAVLGRRRVRRNTRGATQEPGRVTRVERSALLALLAVTALLVSLPAPQPVAIALTLPPPPDGPTTGFGALIGQVSLGATVSAGQLQLQLSTPDSDPGVQSKDAAADAHVAVTLRTPGAPPVAVPVRGCGRGCFLAATPWRNGVNQLRVEAKTIGWHGGAATFTVPWPPVDATAQLRAVLDALRATGTLTLTEGVTSDTTGPTAVRQLRVTSSDFLESEPYGNGGAPTVTALPRQAGAPRLAVAYPAVGVYVVFTLDGRDRPTREVEATPNHLITRTFRYPTP